MPTLNRFPLLGLWAKEAARRVGYRADEAESLGHAYAVLYAIRARGKPREASEEGEKPARRARKPAKVEQVLFGGDELDVVRDKDGKVRGLVGGERPQTPASYHTSVENKFPPGYYARLEQCFRHWLKEYRPSQLRGRLVYNLYDEWKKTCGVGRRVDLDRLIEWCEQKAREK